MPETISQTADSQPRLITQPNDEYCYSYRHQHPLVACVRLGERVTMETLGTFTGRVISDDCPVSECCPPPYDIDPLRVNIYAIEPDRDFAVTATIKHFVGLVCYWAWLARCGWATWWSPMTRWSPGSHENT